MPHPNRRFVLAALGAAALPVPAFSADPWETDPSKWQQKDLQKLLTDSPWARNVSVAMGGPSVGPIGGGGGGRGGRGGGGGGGGSMPDASGSGGMGGEGGPGGGGRGGGMAPTMNFLIRWQTARPVKIASVRARMGAEADTSQQAKEYIEREEKEYVIAVVMPNMRPPGQGRPGAPKGGPEGDRKGNEEEAAAKLKEVVWLSWKNHEKVHPTSITMPREGQSAFIFHFAKEHPIELEDKEVEFAMRRGNLEVKKKFKLKDMVFQGKLAL
jgi:hypothetical protein